MPHIFAGTVSITDVTRFVAFQKQKLAGAFIGVDFGGQGAGVGKFQRHMAFPFRFQRRHIDDDPAAGIGRLAETDDQHIARNSEIFDRPGEGEAVRRNDAAVGLAIDKAVLVKILRIDDSIVDIGENLEFVRYPGIIAVGRQAVADASFLFLALDKWLDHAGMFGFIADPAVG